jgi:glycosyltransferase involved in cell wall biosynthesis
MAKVSIITPTLNRQHFLPAIWDCVRQQSHRDIEWLVHDGSPQPAPMFAALNDPRVRYVHQPQPMTIGARRNALCDAAAGSIIAHFDDDDHYTPHYIRKMLGLMKEQNADFVKLFGFYLFAQTSDTFAYYDLEYDLPFHFVLQANSPVGRGQYVSGPDAQWGYGFSYVYARRVWEAVPFPDRDHGEDHEFARAVIRKFKSAGMQDDARLCVHVIHQSNASIAFPQRVLRRSRLPELFPTF